MNPRRILAILFKDLIDASRDGRVVVLLILPIAAALYFNATTEPEGARPEATVAIAGPSGDRLGQQLKRATSRSVDLTVRGADDEADARKRVVDGDADVGVVVAAGQGDTPSARLILPEDASATAQSVAAVVPDAVARAAGREPASQVTSAVVRQNDQKPGEVMEGRLLTILIALVMFAAFVSMIVVPMQIGEELETGTFGQLRLAATGREVLAAKALGGLVFGAVGIALTVLITKLDIQDVPEFVLASLGLVASLVGFGLLFGLLVANATVINTYGGFLVLPVLAVCVAVFFVNDGWADTVFDLLPFTQATRLLANATSPELPFGALGALPWIVIAAWTVLGWLLLSRIATRREL